MCLQGPKNKRTGTIIGVGGILHEAIGLSRVYHGEDITPAQQIPKTVLGLHLRGCGMVLELEKSRNRVRRHKNLHLVLTNHNPPLQMDLDMAIPDCPPTSPLQIHVAMN